MSAFAYRENTLYCEDAPLADIARREGTPCYVYSKRYISDRLREYDEGVRRPSPSRLLRGQSKFESRHPEACWPKPARVSTSSRAANCSV